LGTTGAYEDLIESRFGVHDRNQFEVKLDYASSPDARADRYRVEAYFFIPSSLGVHRQSYSSENFYGDTKANIRFKTPQLSLAALLDSDNRKSPLVRVRAELDALLQEPHDRGRARRLSFELRLSASIVRASARDRAAALQAALRDGARSEFVSGIHALLGDIRSVRRALREVGPRVLDPVMPAWIGDTYRLVDEYTSLAMQSYATQLLQQLDEHPDRVELSPSRADLVRLIRDERRARTDSGYATVLDAAAPQEHFAYRMGLLKKFANSVLFLDIRRAREGRRVGHFVAAVAAGLAMLFSSVAAIWSQQAYGLNSYPFVLSLVIGYMMKDRIKEGLKATMGGFLTRWIADYDVRIWDEETGVAVGRCRESVSFVAVRDVPPEVLALRHEQGSQFVHRESKPEVVLRYRKQVTLWGRRIAKAYWRMRDVNDIIRFDISHLLDKADDPVSSILAYVPEQDRVALVSCPKVYHLNVVFVLTALGHDMPASYERFRVIFDKSGIRRLEDVKG
jgi:hypothetical protein